MLKLYAIMNLMLFIFLEIKSNSSLILNIGVSELSNKMISAGLNLIICLIISDPIEPAAPVTKNFTFFPVFISL